MFDATRFCTALCLLGLAGGISGAQAATVVVSPDNMGSWAFDNRDGNGTPGLNPTGSGQMVTGPATPPLGNGSAQLSTGNGTTGGDGGEDLRSTFYDGVLLSSITSLSFSTYATLNNGQQFPYLVLDINSTGGAVADSTFRMFFEPPYQTPGTGNSTLPNQGATALNTWQTWNALTGGWWDNSGIGNPGSGVQSFSDFVTAHPNATIALTSTGLGGLQLRVGYASPGDQFNGYVDNVTVGVNGNDKTYDFEPLPEPGTLGVFGLALLGLRAVRGRGRPGNKHASN